MTAPGPYGPITIRDVCGCRCHRVGNPEDVMCLCRDCGADLEQDATHLPKENR